MAPGLTCPDCAFTTVYRYAVRVKGRGAIATLFTRTRLGLAPAPKCMRSEHEFEGPTGNRSRLFQSIILPLVASKG
jgi:hypothetical protein